MSTEVRIENTNGRWRSIPLLFLFLAVLLGTGRSHGAQATLAWNSNSETNIAGYKLFYGTATRNYSGFVSVGSTTTNGTVTNLLVGQTYYFAVTAYCTDGLESDYSAEVSHLVTSGTVNQAPVANAGSVSGPEDQAISVVLTGSDADGDPLTYTLTAAPNNGTVSGTAPNLTYTPAAGFFGSDSLSFRVNDGKTNSTPATITITVNSVNDAPTLAAIGNLTLSEDASAQTVNLSGIGTGAGNESQTLTVTATSSNPGLVPNPTVNYTSPGSTGSLNFTPVANANGSATITVTVNDGQPQNNTASRTFTVTINAVNDVPTLAAPGNITVNEDVGAQTVSLTGIGSGASGESQTLTVTASSSNPGLVPNPTINYTSPNATGNLSFTPVANGNGSATITVTVNDGQAQNNTVSQTFVVTVNSVNDAPTLNALSNLALPPNSPAQTVSLSGIGTGAANESQSLTVTAVSSNPSLVPNPAVTYVSPNATGSLSFTPVAGASGTATITVTVNDGQAQSNTVSRTFTVTVAANVAPTLAVISNRSISEDAAAQSVSLSGIGTGSASEIQTLTVTATSSNPSLIPNPTVTYASPGATGSLSFTPVADANGTATITVTVDDGQSLNNTFSRTFTVTVSAVNDAPNLAAIGNLSLNEDSGVQAVSLSGIGTGAGNESQALTVTATSSNPGLVPNPTVNYTSPNAAGTLSFTPVANGNGTATITVTVNDGQAQNNTVSQAFIVTVNAVNDAPTLNALSNLSLAQNSGAQTVSLSGIGSGAANESQSLTVTAVSSNPGLIPNPAVSYTSPNAAGSLNFTPVAGASGTAVITVTADDGQAQNNTVSRTFTVSVAAGNQPPTLAGIIDQSVNEDVGAQSVALTGIGSGSASENQTLTITATSSNPGVIPNPTVAYTSPNTTGGLNFTPVANASGTATITVTVNDGQALNNLASQTFTITVNPVNDVPTLNALSNLSLPLDAGAQSVNLSGIGSGAANESQSLTVTAVSSNPSLVPNPAVTYVNPNATGSLNFTPVAGASGTATITVTVNDGQAQNNLATRTFTVTVAANQAPTLAVISNRSLNEDAVAQSVSLSGIGTGSASEIQTLTITATSSDTSVIPNPTVTYTSPSATGSLSFTPVADANGTATITVTVDDGQSLNNAVSRTFTVTVSAVNDAPDLASIGNLTLSEDSGVQTVSLSGIGTGAGNESQALTVTATSSNPGLVPNPTVNYTSPNATGNLSLAPVANGNGSATITVTVNDGQAQNNTVSQTFVVTVNSVNDAPTLAAIIDQSVNEDVGVQSVALSGIGSGSASENQTLTITATSSNPGVIPNPTVAYTSPNTTGGLNFTPVANASGTATITVTVNDGQALNNLASQTFTITVNPVNDIPTLNALSNLSLPLDAGAQSVNLSGIGSGAANESQSLTVTAVSSNPSLVPNPAVTYVSPNATGSLNFTPVAGASGTATITVTVNDGQAQNNLATRTFTVTVAANQAPTLAVISNRSLNEDAVAQSVSLSGIGSGSASENQTLTITATSSDPSLIPNPTVSYASPGTTGSLSFTPVADANGTATITVTVDDGQALNSTVSRTFTVTVNAVNDAPVLASISNLSLNEDPGVQTVTLSGIGSGAANESQTLAVTAASSNTGLIPNPTVTYASPNATGALTFTPVANANGSATITVTVNDGQSQNNTVTRTFTVSVGAVNDGPTLAALGNVTVNEDASAQTVSLSGIGAGAGNESQTLAVTATSSNPGLVPNPTVNYTSPNAAGTLSFTPVANGNGSATITVTVDDGQAQNNTVSQTFIVTVNAVNDAPTLNALSNLSLAQDPGPQTVNLSGIGSGAADENQALTVTAVSSNPSLVPNPTVNYASPAATGTLDFTPVTGAGGTATITVTVDDGQPQNDTTIRTFTVSVSSGNQPPTINALSDVVISEDAQQQLVNFSGLSAGGAGESQTLTVTATSSNPSLIPDPNVTYSSPNSGGSLRFLPARDGFGTATITVTVDDGQPVNHATTRTFLVTVNSVNDVPTLNNIADVDYYEDTGLHVVQLTGISTGASNELQTLNLVASSSNPSVIPHPLVTYSSPGATATLTLNPLADTVGSAVVTVTLSDGGATQNQVTRTFGVAIRGLNDPPVISQIEDQFLAVNEGSGPIPFTLQDVDTALSSVGLTVTSSDTTLIPQSGLVLGGSGINRTLSITPAVSRAGTSFITLIATDGYTNNTMTFTVVVGSLNAPPAISTLPDQTIEASTTLADVPFTVSDAETPATNLVVTASSYNKLVVPDAGIVLQGNGNSRKISVTPAPGKSGQVAIGIIVSDGTRQSQTSFQLTVLPPKSRLVVNKKGKGHVQPDLDGQTLNVGESYSMTAFPDAGQVFSTWGGDVIASSEVLVFVMQSNMVIEATFEADPFILAKGTYSGLLAETDEVRHERSGNFTLTSTARGTYSGRLLVGRSKVAVKGLLAIDGKATNVVSRPGLTPLTVEVALEVGDAPGHMTGRVTDGAWTAQLQGDRRYYNARTNPAPFAGTYTLVVPSDGQAGPQGSGYGTVKVDGNGVATFIGMMADGTKAAQKVAVSRDGNWPFYLWLYKGGGSALGWLGVTNDDVGGLVSWIKPAMTCKFYTEGLTNETMVVGAAYVPPTLVELQGGGVRRTALTCTGANLGETVTAELMLLPNGRMMVQGGETFKFGLSPKLGLFKGAVLDPATGKPHSFGGVMLQKWSVGSGLIYGTNQVGLIEVSQQ